MIIGHDTGDITGPHNQRDIIIGMNTSLRDVTNIGLPFTAELKLTSPLTLGGILSSNFDASRRLHMLICHKLGQGGWNNSDKFVRFGLDYLWYRDAEDGQNDRQFSIVEIGRGRVGRRDGADPVAIHQAMTTAHLPLTLFVNHVHPGDAIARQALVLPLHVYRVWTPDQGEELLAA